MLTVPVHKLHHVNSSVAQAPAEPSGASSVRKASCLSLVWLARAGIMGIDVNKPNNPKPQTLNP